MLSGSGYRPPRGQYLFSRWCRSIDILGSNTQYYNEDTYNDEFDFGSEKFNIKDIYQYYYSNVSKQSSNI